MGHPDKDSFCSALASAYIEGVEESGAEVKRINIGDLTFDPNLRKGYKIDQKLELDLVKAQGHIRWADHIVWVFPIWWSFYPAIMKGFMYHAKPPHIHGFTHSHDSFHLYRRK